MEGLVFKYEHIITLQTLDNILYEVSNMGTVYTFSGPSDYDPQIHPSPAGFVEIRRYGSTSTLQQMTTPKGLFVRTKGTGDNAVWTEWVQI